MGRGALAGALAGWAGVVGAAGAETPGISEATAVEAARVATAGGEVEDIWSAKVPEFREDAPVGGVPTVLYFTATWCGYCRQMERTTLASSSVRSRLAPFGRVKLDFDQQPELVARYQIRGVPAFVMVDARGREVARLVGAVEPDPFRGWLEDGGKRAVEAARVAERRRLELRHLVETLGAAGPEAWEKNKARVFELAGRGEPGERGFALKELVARAETKPSLLFDGLLHEDLAVRIAVTGVLRKSLGERFVFDPWADAATRKATVRDETFVMRADASVAVEVEARFVEFRGVPAEGTALGVLLKAGNGRAGAVVGELSSEQVAAVLREVNTMKGAEVVLAPKVTAGSGLPARVAIGQEMRYPTRWVKDPAGAGWTPGGFETRTVGVEMAVRSQAEPGGVIALAVTPTHTRFEGFIDTVTTKETQSLPVVPGSVLVDGKAIEMNLPATPIFTVRTATAEVSVPAGRTVVLRGGDPKTVAWAPESVMTPPAGKAVTAEGVTTLVFVSAKVAPPAKRR